MLVSTLTEGKYLSLNFTLFTKPPFTFLGGSVRAESLFGRDGLQSVLFELDQIVRAA
jgi:hypothetical protein